MTNTSRKTALFETVAVPKALLTMAVPTIVSQLITLIYNMADTWFIGRTNNPYMVAASSVTRATLIQRNMNKPCKSKGFSTLVISFLLV